MTFTKKSSHKNDNLIRIQFELGVELEICNEQPLTTELVLYQGFKQLYLNTLQLKKIN